MRKKVFVILIVFLLVMGLAPTVSLAATITVTGGDYNIENAGAGDIINVSGTVKLYSTNALASHDIRVVCAAGTQLTIQNIGISSASGPAISFTGTGNTLTQLGSSYLASTGSYPAVKVNSGTSLVINGTDFFQANGGENSAGIGSSGLAGTIVISNGSITAVGGKYGAGIGGGFSGGGGLITINSGTVTAYGGENSAGIGGGYNGASGTITINGGTVSAYGSEDNDSLTRTGAAGIGGGYNGSGKVIITGGVVTATGAVKGAGIGGGYNKACQEVTISGGSVTANGGSYGGAGIGSGAAYDASSTITGGKITITGGTVNANAVSNAGGAGIGGGSGGTGGEILIQGGTVNAIGSSSGAGIGGGSGGNAGTITIEGGTIKAVSNDYGAGIGSGFNGIGQAVVISGGNVYAQSSRAQDIGGGLGNAGAQPVGGTLSISGDSAVFLHHNVSTGVTTTTHVHEPGVNCTMSSVINTYSLTGVDTSWQSATGGYFRAYRLTYDNNEGLGSVTARRLPAGTEITLSTGTGLSKTGYTFDGWNTLDTGLGTHYEPGASYAVPTADVTLYAEWEPNSNTLTYHANGGAGTTTENHDTGEVFTLTEASVTRTGYDFAEWDTEENGGGTSYADEASFTMPATDETLYAQWTAHTYTVEYMANDGMGTTASSSHTYGISKALTSSGFAMDYHTFAGWSTTPNGEVEYFDGQSVVNLTAEDGATITLYAQWTPYTYMVDYNMGSGDGGATLTSSHTYGEESALTLNGFTKTNYTFAGWAETENGEAVYTDGQMVLNLTDVNGGIIMLYAVWAADPQLTSSDADAKVFVGGRITLTPNIEGGTWDWDEEFFSATFNSPATFTALKVGTSTITYTVEGVSTTYDVTIEAGALPGTGQNFMWAYLLIALAAAAALAAIVSAALRKKKQM